MVFRSKIAQIFVGLSVLYFVAIFVLTTLEVREALKVVEDSGGLGSEFLSSVYITAFQRIVDPVFLFGTAVMIEFLSRSSKYLEGIGIMMAKRDGESTNGE